MGCWLSIWLLLFGASLSVLTSQASYMSWVLRCCSKGRRKADKNGNPNACNKDDLERRRFDNPMDRIICRHAERICCVKTIQKMSCDLGKYDAYQGISCDTFKPYVGGDHFRECCDCCALGIKAKADEAAVCTDFTLSPPCLNVFQDCCNGTTIVSPPTPTIGAIKRRCSENFCQHLCRDSPTEGAVCFCRNGYSLQDDKTSCRDLDECQFGGDSLCGPLQQCVNTPGSFRCDNSTEAACKLGRERLNGRCIDVDECARGIDRCGSSQKCNNNDGSYSCTCKTGYQASGKNCLDIDECTSGQHSCSKEEQCENTQGSFKCAKSTECPPGTRYKEDRCEDIDECARNPGICDKGFICSNTIGSYTCDPRPACPSGKEFVNGRCQGPCDGVNCGFGLKCKESGRSYTCEDIDECTIPPRKCTGDNEMCINTYRSYKCQCMPQFRRNLQNNRCERPCDGVNCGFGLKCKESGNSYTCEDIDECSIPPRKCTGDNEICINTYRSYKCQCRPQFKKNPSTNRCERTTRCTGVSCPTGYRCVNIDEKNFQCKDIDECAESPPKCASDQNCLNYPGGHYCTCRTGFRLNSLTNRCEDINECLEKTSGCNQVCENSPGSFACRCYRGYEMSTNGRTCTDIDECSQRQCSQRCENTPGSFVCRCERGYELDSDGYTCKDRNECDSVTCAYRCWNNLGSYRCICPRGYNITRQFYCSDIDECELGTASCKEDSFCFNTYGSSRCIPKIVCPNGYKAVSDTRCDRNCPEGDQACFSKKEQRFSLWTLKLRNMESPHRIFTYRIVTYGYRTRPEVRFYFKHGNEGDQFGIETQRENNGVIAYVSTKQRISGPKIFFLEFRGDVIDTEKGELASRFVHRMYVFVSRYDF